MARQYLIPGYGYINETGTRQYLIPGGGYVNETVSVSIAYTQAVAGDYPAPSGFLSYIAAFLEPLSGAFPAPSGDISKHTGKSVSGAFSAPSGDTVKGTSKDLTGTFPAPSGTPGESISVHKAVSGIMGAIVGAITTVLNPIIDITSRTVKIIGSSFKRMIGG